jgi:hypothetical protein
MGETDLLRRLKSLARRRERIEADLQRCQADIRQGIVEGVEQGIPKTMLAEAAGISRQAIYNVLYGRR